MHKNAVRNIMAGLTVTLFLLPSGLAGPGDTGTNSTGSPVYDQCYSVFEDQTVGDLNVGDAVIGACQEVQAVDDAASDCYWNGDDGGTGIQPVCSLSSMLIHQGLTPLDVRQSTTGCGLCQEFVQTPDDWDGPDVPAYLVLCEFLGVPIVLLVTQSGSCSVVQGLSIGDHQQDIAGPLSPITTLPDAGIVTQADIIQVGVCELEVTAKYGNFGVEKVVIPYGCASQNFIPFS